MGQEKRLCSNENCYDKYYPDPLLEPGLCENCSILVLKTGNGLNSMFLHNNRKDEMIFDSNDFETAKIEFEKEENCLKNTYKTTSFLRKEENWNDKFEPKESDLVRVELTKVVKNEDDEIEIIETVLISDDFYCGK